jgi:hypothetical protein
MPRNWCQDLFGNFNLLSVNLVSQLCLLAKDWLDFFFYCRYLFNHEKHQWLTWRDLNRDKNLNHSNNLLEVIYSTNPKSCLFKMQVYGSGPFWMDWRWNSGKTLYIHVEKYLNDLV